MPAMPAMPAVAPFKPSKADLAHARTRTVADILAPRLRVLFVGINPGLYTAAIGHHFGRPGNRFWAALHTGGFTPRLLSPFEEKELLPQGLGVTNVVRRTTATAAELSDDDYRKGGKILEQKIREHAPRLVAILGIGAFRVAFNRPKAEMGLQKETIGGSNVWVLPNPSGLNAHFTAADFGKLFAEVRVWLEKHS